MKSDEALLVLSELDQVGVALKPLAPGDVVHGVAIRTAIHPGHKVALRNLDAGEPVLKYGHPIGITTAPVQAGDWVHSHNLRTRLSGKVDYTYTPVSPGVSPQAGSKTPQTFRGYVRNDGQVGVRNEVWIINTVGCVNKTAERLAQMANQQLSGPGLDGFYTFSHPYGCSQLGDDLMTTQDLLARLVHHPNAAGVLVLGLGCENNQVTSLAQVIGPLSQKRVKYLTVQEVQDEWATGLELLGELADYARSFERVALPASRLIVGLKCGGSDGFSGITANPLVGLVSDKLVAQGGTTLLTEVPEMFGAETILMDRARDTATFHKVVDLINDFKDYYTARNQVIYENPSPGNKDGGITTLEEKSLGCIQKGGQSPVVGVVGYADPVRTSGLNLVQAPGNDAVSVTALAAAGAHIVLFTTGRGTPWGGPVPTIKISTNSELASKKPGWIDFDAGQILAGVDRDALAEELLDYILKVASGEAQANNEQHGFREIAIFKDGVTL